MPEKDNQQQHIPYESKSTEEDGHNSEPRGLLAPVGDPVGNALNTTLRPLGAILEKGVTGPLGDVLGSVTRGTLGPLVGSKEERLEILGGESEDTPKEPSKVESIGGKEQTGQNPLGLNQSK